MVEQHARFDLWLHRNFRNDCLPVKRVFNVAEREF